MRPLAILSLVLLPVITQTDGPGDRLEAPSFDTASVRVNRTAGTRAVFIVPASGSVTITNATLRELILRAYGVPIPLAPYFLLGGPERILETRFDVHAVPPVNTPQGMAPLMLRTLLAERFRLKMHSEVRDVPSYALTVVRRGVLGPQLRASTHDCVKWVESVRAAGARIDGDQTPRGSDNRPWCFPSPVPGGAIHMRDAATIGKLARDLQAFVNRPLVDRTELMGNFEWELTFAPDTDSQDGDGVPGVFTALREQLGLTIQSVTIPFEVFVIESVEMPTAN